MHSPVREPAAKEEGRARTLRDLAPGERGRVRALRGRIALRKRLLEMGFVPGAVVEKLKLAPLADPAEYRVKGCHLSLRNSEARDVLLVEEGI